MCVTFSAHARNCYEETDDRHGPMSGVPALNTHTLPHQKVNQPIEMDSVYHVGYLFVEP